MLGRCLKEEGEVSEAEYSYLASLLRKALKDTREEEDAQQEVGLPRLRGQFAFKPQHLLSV